MLLTRARARTRRRDKHNRINANIDDFKNAAPVRASRRLRGENKFKKKKKPVCFTASNCGIIYFACVYNREKN